MESGACWAHPGRRAPAWCSGFSFLGQLLNSGSARSEDRARRSAGAKKGRAQRSDFTGNDSNRKAKSLVCQVWRVLEQGKRLMDFFTALASGTHDVLVAEEGCVSDISTHQFRARGGRVSA